MERWSWQIENDEYLKKAVKRCKEQKILLPTFNQLKHPAEIPDVINNELEKVGLEEINPLNLFRINWRNDPKTGKICDINYLEIPREITGIKARVIGLVGKFFPTGAHKVGATYGCLAPFLVTGRFNPEYHKAVWPSTGNFCRGGVFNSRLLSVHGVAILPEEMSRERFDWLKNMGAEIYATYGCESNVKEIYDKCHELVKTSDEYLIFNQFEQFGNPVWHYEVTGYTLEDLFNKVKDPNSRFSGYVSATGSAGTIGAGDYLRTVYPHVKVLATEALQCPTLLMNGYGAHRIEGIGDKHIPWIHNVKNTDAVCAIDDEDPLRILRLFNEKEGQKWLKKNGVNDETIARLPWLGISSISNMLSSIKLAKYYEMNENDIVFTIFTDSKEMYNSRLDEMNQSMGLYSELTANVDWTSIVKKQSIDYFKELSFYDKKQIHNLKYFTWVEQQGKSVDELNAQWSDETYWSERFNSAAQWDKLIEDFNGQVGIKI